MSKILITSFPKCGTSSTVDYVCKVAKLTACGKPQVNDWSFASNRLNLNASLTFAFYDFFSNLRKATTTPLWKIVQQNQVLHDIPFCLMYKEIDKSFPNSKFIHVLRDSYEWVCSLENYSKKGPKFVGSSILHQFVRDIDKIKTKQPFQWTDETRIKLMKTFQEHNKNVLSYFKDKTNFIALNMPFSEDDELKLFKFTNTTIKLLELNKTNNNGKQTK